MNFDAYTIYFSLFASYFALKPIAYISTLLQLPSLFIEKHVFFKYYQIPICILSDLFQIYFICCIPVYGLNYKWENNLTVTILSLLIICFAILTSLPNTEGNHYYTDEIESYFDKVCNNTRYSVRIIATIPMYIILFCMPHLVWKTPVAWIMNVCSLILHIPVIGFIIKAYMLFTACYYVLPIIAPVLIFIGSLVIEAIRDVFRSNQE